MAEMNPTDESETREEHGGEADVLITDGDRRPNEVEDDVESQQGPEHEVFNHNFNCVECIERR